MIQWISLDSKSDYLESTSHSLRLAWRLVSCFREVLGASWGNNRWGCTESDEHVMNILKPWDFSDSTDSTDSTSGERLCCSTKLSKQFQVRSLRTFLLLKPDGLVKLKLTCHHPKLSSSLSSSSSTRSCQEESSPTMFGFKTSYTWSLQIIMNYL